MTLCVADIAYYRTESGDQPYGSPTQTIGDGFPKEGGDTQNDDLNACEVGWPSEGYPQIHGKLLKGGYDRGRRKGTHHAVKRHENQVEIFLPWVSLARILRGGTVPSTTAS